MDRFDLRIEVPPVAFADLDLPTSGDTSAEVAARVVQARQIQAERYKDIAGLRQNADVEGTHLEQVAAPDASGKELLSRMAEKTGLSARGYHRVLRVARTIADLDGQDGVQRSHVAEALSFRVNTMIG